MADGALSVIILLTVAGLALGALLDMMRRERKRRHHDHH